MTYRTKTVPIGPRAIGSTMKSVVAGAVKANTKSIKRRPRIRKK